jgi:hypothetical protein
MKAILIALMAELLLFACVSAFLRWGITQRRASFMVITFLSVLPVLLALHLLTPPDLDFAPAELVMPIAWVDLAFAVFLYGVGFFGGILQLYNLADRGLSLRILIDISEAPSGAMRLDDVIQGYGAGRGIAWMYAKRLEDLQSAGLAKVEGESLVLTPKGQHVAKLFKWLQGFARVAPIAGKVTRSLDCWLGCCGLRCFLPAIWP